MSTKAKVFVYANPFKGDVKLTDFKFAEEQLPPLRDGQFLAKASFISVDPYAKTLALSFPVGTTMTGRQVAE